MQLVWFKRDLRVEDHGPLVEAASRGPVACVYVLEDAYLAHPMTSPLHVSFLLSTLSRLRTRLREMGGQLYVYRGDVVEVFNDLHNRHQITGLWSHQETGLDFTYRRDLRVKDWASEVGVPWVELRQHGVFRALKDRDGWAARWHRDMDEAPLPAPGQVRWADLDAAALRVPELSELTVLSLGGERSAAPPWEPPEALLRSFLEERGQDYQKGMSAPGEAWDKCSRLSPHIALGSLSLKTVLHETRARTDALRRQPVSAERKAWLSSLNSFGKRLRWHCHFMQKLETEPELEFQAMHRHLRGLRPTPPDSRLLDAWSEGRTGYPMVDACMRSLNETGWLNFRMRAMLVSFATYHLWLPWTLVSERLARKFMDFEPGIHICQVQMQSGVTGINTLRIYSPTKQQADHDPDGAFVRRWVPELRDVPIRDLLSGEPMLGDLFTPAPDYPRPIVEHREATRAARSAIWAIRKTPQAKEESQRVYEKHGSRRRPTQRRRGAAPRQAR